MSEKTVPWSLRSVFDCCRVLEIPATSDLAAAKKAYLEKVKQHHPDLHFSNPEAAKKAQATFLEVQAAYDQLVRLQTWSAEGVKTMASDSAMERMRSAANGSLRTSNLRVAIGVTVFCSILGAGFVYKGLRTRQKMLEKHQEKLDKAKISTSPWLAN